MPYVGRDNNGQIEIVSSNATADAEEWLSADHADLIQFLEQQREQSQFTELDADFIRVIEDLIDTLITKGVLRLTDLPQDAQKKLLARKTLRGRLRDDLKLLDDDEVI